MKNITTPSALWKAARKATETASDKSMDPPAIPVIKKKRVVEPIKLIKNGYLETNADVDEFLKSLRRELEDAISHNERVEIR